MDGGPPYPCNRAGRHDAARSIKSNIIDVVAIGSRIVDGEQAAVRQRRNLRPLLATGENIGVDVEWCGEALIDVESPPDDIGARRRIDVVSVVNPKREDAAVGQLDGHRIALHAGRNSNVTTALPDRRCRCHDDTPSSKAAGTTGAVLRL